MLTAMLAVENILGASYDLWAVNTEPEHVEERVEVETVEQYKRLASTQPLVPERVTQLRSTPAESEI